MSTSPRTTFVDGDLTTLTRQLRTPQSASVRADTLDAIRRLLPTLQPTCPTQPIADAVAHVLKTNPSNLLLAHRAVAVLAHPVLSGGAGIDRAIVAAMDRLSMSAAFQHTAMAALQNAAAVASTPVDRDAVILAVVSAMRSHHAQNGVLLRGADLIAYHLNQSTHPPLTSSFRVATRVIVDTVDKLSVTPQGASTALLALVATARHISSPTTFTAGRPSTAKRFSKSGVASAIVDHQFAFAVVLAMSRHRSYPPVQLLGCELIRVAAAGATSVARLAAKELFAAGAAAAVVAALHAHPTDASVVDRGVVALRSLLLGGGFHGRAVKPGLHVDADFAEYVACVVDRVSDSVSVKDRDLGSAATVLAMDVRTALAPTYKDRLAESGSTRISELGKRIIRRIRFGQRQNFYEGDFDRFGDDSYVDLTDSHLARPVKEMSAHSSRSRRASGRSSFAAAPPPPHRRLGTAVSEGADPDPRNPESDIKRTNRKLSEGTVATADTEGAQIAVNRRWRSVSGRWNQRGRRGSSVSNVENVHSPSSGAVPVKRERRGPLTLSGSEMANLTRQPSRVFGGGHDGEVISRKKDLRSRESRKPFMSVGHEDFGL